jgi:hypothetical protein
MAQLIVLGITLGSANVSLAVSFKTSEGGSLDKVSVNFDLPPRWSENVALAAELSASDPQVEAQAHSVDFDLVAGSVSHTVSPSDSQASTAARIPLLTAPLLTAPPPQSDPLAPLFAGGTDSLVARAVGSAEGTRTPEGDRTSAYWGHSDPGNRAWNLGSFSYQHSAKSPEEADAKQLNVLRQQAIALTQKAQQKNLQINLEELLNGIDLANQAPRAALDRSGYIDWLATSRQQGRAGSDGIVWARTHSFINPATQRWDAPGLGNTEARITADQRRRMLAIQQAIEVQRGQ